MGPQNVATHYLAKSDIQTAPAKLNNRWHADPEIRVVKANTIRVIG